MGALLGSGLGLGVWRHEAAPLVQVPMGLLLASPFLSPDLGLKNGLEKRAWKQDTEKGLSPELGGKPAKVLRALQL